MTDKSSESFVGGIILGATVGALAGLLLAPRSGRETRRILRKSASALPELVEDFSYTLHLQADRLSDAALQNWEDTLNRLRAAVIAGQAASQQHYEALSQPETPVKGEPSSRG